jgi:predicted amidohydrolase YtcJ
MVQAEAQKLEKGTWIAGRGWHQEKWNEVPEQNILGYPKHYSLSEVSKDHPVILYHASGHSLYANELAMKAAGITKETPDPAGGLIVRDEDNEAIGVFEERAMSLIKNAYKEYLDSLSQDQLLDKWYLAIEKAEEECLKKGITSFQDAGSLFEELDRYEALAEAGELDLRLWAMARQKASEMENVVGNYRKIGVGNDFFTCRAIKSEVDGALGAYGAWLLKPYEDKEGWVGQNTTTIYDVKKIADMAKKHDMQLCVHAIGDRANRVVVDIFEGMIKQMPGVDHRWRVEHAQHLDPADIPRFAEHNIIASMQGIHCTSDAPFVVKRLGEKRAKEGAYAWRSLLDAGVTIANGTDAPVEDVDPLKSFYASVTRKREDNGMEFFTEQAMTREEALYSYTLGNAYAAFEDDIKGSLEVGKVADIVLLSKDLVTCSDEEILDTEVLYTLVDGEVKYQKYVN